MIALYNDRCMDEEGVEAKRNDECTNRAEDICSSNQWGCNFHWVFLALLVIGTLRGGI